MTVVSDTSPLSHAILIGEERVFRDLFGAIVIPSGVAEELASPGAPEIVRSWISRPPGWLSVQAVESESVPSNLAHLHRGELEAILLARHTSAEFVLLDERAARRAAGTLGIKVLGLLGILDQAARRGWLDFAQALDRLVATDFYLSPELVDKFLKRHQLQ